MKKKFISGLLVIILCCLTGCVSDSEYDELKAQYDEVSAELKNREDMYFELQDDYNSLSGEYAELQREYEDLQATETDIIYEQPTSLADYDTTITYDDLVQNPEQYKGKAICMTGIVTQMTSTDDGICLLTIAADGDYNNFIDFVYDSNNIDAEISLNDNVDLYGLFNGLYNEDTKPLIIGVYVDVN